ncbi:hypothetical protein ACE6H2_020517 [Prunus campanulata]
MWDCWRHPRGCHMSLRDPESRTSCVQSTPPPSSDLVHWLQNSVLNIQIGGDSELLIKLLLICWKVWESRNQKVFQPRKPSSCWTSIIFTNQLPPPPTIKWNPAAPSYLKINFYGSLRFDGNCSAGYVMRDSNGSPLYASTRSCGIYVLIAEGHALLDGIIIVALLCALETYDHSGQQQSMDSSFQNQCEQSI